MDVTPETGVERTPVKIVIEPFGGGFSARAEGVVEFCSTNTEQEALFYLLWMLGRIVPVDLRGQPYLTQVEPFDKIVVESAPALSGSPPDWEAHQRHWATQAEAVYALLLKHARVDVFVAGEQTQTIRGEITGINLRINREAEARVPVC